MIEGGRGDFRKIFCFMAFFPELDSLECPGPWWENPCIPHDAK